VQHAAVQAAVEQARLRRGVSDVFRNLARRNQSLLHRQLSLLDGMERRIADPDELADLYRLDHLTTRMRRHAEGLIILSGAPIGRSWRNPVRLVDVLRAAVGEVEDYTRVSVTTMTGAALVGPAVADVIHLVAELVENATIFSPPNTPVRVTGDVVGNGFAVEIEDRGSAWPRRSWPRSTAGWPAHRSSTCPTPISSGCSSRAGSPRGRASRSRCAPTPTAARRRSC